MTGQEFTVETPSRGSIFVVWTDETQCRPGPCADIAVGDHIGAVGQLEGATLAAARVVVAPDAPRRPHVAGRVESATGHVLHVFTRSGETVNVHWDADTACAPVDCDVPLGARILAVGAELGGPNLDASHIRIRLPGTAIDAARLGDRG